MFRKRKSATEATEYQFIGQVRFQSICDQIHDLSGLPNEHFQLFYKLPLDRFLALTQHCEEQEVLEHFKAVVRSLKKRRSLILPLDSDAESINKQKDLWTYAIFVGALMFNATELIAQQVLYKDHAEYVKWSPFEPPIPRGRHIRSLGKIAISPYATSLLLPFIFCSRCLSWLYRDPLVFNTALELAHAPNPRSRLGQLITHAHTTYREAQDPASALSQDTNAPSETTATASSNQNPATLEQPNPPAIGFRQWLKETIKNNRLPQFICETIEGYAISDPAIFDAYCNGKSDRNIEDERNAFLKLNLHKNGPPIKFSGGPKKNALYINDLDTL